MEEIWQSTLNVVKKAINNCRKKNIKILTIGITNQRETTVVWNKINGKPVCKAIVWQDRRTDIFCKKLKNRNIEDKIKKKTGLFIDS